MTWTMWRLHRNQLAFAIAGLAALALLLLVTGINMASTYHQALAACGATKSCASLPSELFQGDTWLFDVVNLTLVVPALLGVFWGAPLLGKEFEDGTHKLAWAQSVTRRRWLSANIGWALLAAVVWGAAISGLVTWWLGPENALQLDRFHGGQFDIQGLMPIACSVFAVALGIAAGAWLRRVLPAIATTLGVYVAVRAVIEFFARPHYLSASTQSFPFSGASDGPAGAAWVLSNKTVNAAGQSVAGSSKFGGLPSACRSAASNSGLHNCLSAHGWRSIITFQPASRFWAFQGIEAAIFLVLAVALIGVAFRRVLTTDA
jgi:hypothetical protein